MPYGRDVFRSTSLLRDSADLAPYNRAMSRVLGGSKGGGRFLMREAPLYWALVGHSRALHAAPTSKS